MLIVVFLCIAVGSIFPNSVYAQSEEDILNSIGAELESEAEKKEAEEKKEKEYESLKSKADGYMKGEKYDKARETFKAMSKIFPDRDYPTRQIRLADQLEEKAKMAEKQEQYDKLMADADNLFAKDKLAEAKTAYENASKVLPDEALPKEKIKVIAKKIAEAEAAKKAAEIKQKYDVKVAEADKAFSSSNWDQATQLYKAALSIKSDESYPTEQLKQIEVKKKEEEERKQQEALDSKYQAILKEADGLLSSKKWDDAKEKYSAASRLKPNEAYPKEKITEAEQLKKQEEEQKAQAALDEKYNRIIEEADGLLKNQQFDDAIAKYQEASKVKPSESYPKTQIDVANQQKTAAAEEAAQAEKQAQYDGIIKEADDLLKNEQFDQAIAKYEEAKGVLPSESYPQEQITKANEQKAAKAQGELQAQYDAIVKEADDLLKNQQFDDAIAKYQEASKVKPSESYPKTQIDVANQQKTAAAEEAAQAKKQAQYDGIIKEADDLLKNEQFDQAISKYEEAKRILPTENYPAEQIAKAKELKAAAASQKEQAEKQAEYETIIAGADELFNSGDFEGSIAKYQEAQAVLPNETYPQEQIAKANEGLTQLQNQKAEAEQLEAAYATAMETGTAAMTSEDFAGAIAAFKEATKLKKDSQEAKDKLQEAEIALQQFESQQKAADKAAKEEEKKREEYNEIITNADAEFAAGEFTSAISMYKQAQTLFPEEAYPGTQIAAADAAIAEKELAAQKEREAEAAAKDAEEKQYQDLLTQGDQAKDNQEYQAAIGFYQQAAALKPDAEIPATKIETVNTLIAQAEEEQRLAAEKEAELAAKNKEFDDKIAQGNQALERNEFTEAISLFNQAKSIDPNSTIPADRIAKAEEAMQAAADAEEQAELAEQERLEAIEEQYSSLIGEAELLVQQKNYFDAIAKFEEAKAVKPTAMGPQERIDHVRRLIRKEEEEKRKAEEAIQAQQQLEQGFKKALEEGDAALAANDFVKAKNAYRRAQQLKLDDPVPTEKLAKAEELQAAYEAAEAERKAQEEAERKAAAEAQAKAEQQQKAYDEAIEEANRFFNAKEYDQAAAGYLKASDIKPEMEYPKSQLAEIARLRKEQEAEQAKQREIAQKKREAEEAARKKSEEERKKKAAEAKKAAEERANKAREDRIKRYQELQPEALAAKYPSGISHEEYDDGQRKVKKSTIVENGQGRQLMRYKYPWGAEFFFLNGKQITKDAYYWNMRKYR